MTNEIPRRIRVDRYTPAEKAIHDAIQVVEAAGAHPLLTDAVILLDKAREKVADFVDDVAPTAEEEVGQTRQSTISAAPPSAARSDGAATKCPTCGGDGVKFDANCPAAWAHRFVNARATDARTEGET